MVNHLCGPALFRRLCFFFLTIGYFLYEYTVTVISELENISRPTHLILNPHTKYQNMQFLIKFACCETKSKEN